MTTFLFFLSDITASGVRAAACLFLFSRLLSCNKPGRKSIAAAFAGTAVIRILFMLSVNLSATGSQEFSPMAGIACAALEAVWLTVCARRFQSADTRLCLFVGFFYEIAVSFWKFLFAAWLGVFLRSPAFLDSRTASSQIPVWLLCGLLLAFLFRLAGQQDDASKELFRFLSVIVVAGFLAVIALSEQTVITIAEDTLSMWTILAVLLMMSVLVFHMNRQYETEKELARLKAEQAELLERDYTTLNNAYAVNAKLFHDFHNHIGALQQLLSHNKIEEAVQYLNALQAPVQEMTDTVWTGDETIDYLINSKTAVAEAAGITLQAQVEFPRHTNIRSADLCAILGNFLDNAIEAAGQVPKTEQRLIQLTIRRINQMLVIKVENSFAAVPVTKDGRLQTTKTDGGLHGWGLKSALTAAEKYDGTVQTSYADGVFRAVATLSYQGVTVT